MNRTTTQRVVSPGVWVVPLARPLVRTHMVRGSLLVTSREQLRAAGFFEAYNAHLGEAARRELDGLVAASWLSIELAHDHFTALDAVGLSDSEIFACTRLTAEKLHRTGLSVA